MHSAVTDQRDVARLCVFFATLYFIQGIGDPTSGLIAQPVRSLLRAWEQSPATIAGFMALLALPWSLKPLFGVLSDFVPLFGSRRRNYLLMSCASASVGLLVLYLMPLPREAVWLLFAMLLLPTIAIAFGDVLVDAVMVETGQPRGLTGRFQSVQWTAAYGALLLVGVLGGYLAETERQELAFLLCALIWGVSLVLTYAYVEDREQRSTRVPVGPAARTFLDSWRRRGLATVCIILFVWSFNPMWVTVLYLHMTDTLGFSEQQYGNTYSVFAGGCMVASFLYGLYCRRVRMGYLVHGSIFAGVLANIIYFNLATIEVAYGVSFLAGFAFMTGTLIQLDIAARLVPLRTAATLFASIMALTNIAASLSEGLGGWLFEIWSASHGATSAYRYTVLLSSLFAATCWLFVGRLKRDVPQWWTGDDVIGHEPPLETPDETPAPDRP
jgi:MFS family permease